MTDEPGDCVMDVIFFVCQFRIFMDLYIALESTASKSQDTIWLLPHDPHLHIP